MTTAQVVLALVPLLPLVALYFAQTRAARAAGEERGRTAAEMDQLQKDVEKLQNGHTLVIEVKEALARLEERLKALTVEVRRLRGMPSDQKTDAV